MRPILRPFAKILAVGVLAIGLAASDGRAGGDARAGGAPPAPVVVELYTSQGCSSCPPADALLARLARRDDVIALALHVDYWDYIGWKDSFARPEFGMRQKAYARAAGHGTVYTPQIIVNGVDQVVGSKPMLFAEILARHLSRPAPVALSVVRRGARLRVTAEPPGDAAPGEMLVQLVRYTPEQTVRIGHGENAGKTITYANIVTEWRTVKRWNGQERLDLELTVDGAQPGAVLIQKVGPGEIVASARLP